MLQLLDFEHYSQSFFTLIAVGLMIACIAVGYITNAVMSNRGFGSYGNSFLVILGAVTGVYTRYAFFGWLSEQEVLIIGTFALAMATLLLMLLGIAKHWVRA